MSFVYSQPKATAASVFRQCLEGVGRFGNPPYSKLSTGLAS